MSVVTSALISPVKRLVPISSFRPNASCVTQLYLTFIADGALRSANLQSTLRMPELKHIDADMNSHADSSLVDSSRITGRHNRSIFLIRAVLIPSTAGQLALFFVAVISKTNHSALRGRCICPRNLSLILSCWIAWTLQAGTLTLFIK